MCCKSKEQNIDSRGLLPGSAFRSRKTTTGFSLVELIVVMGIFTVISSVVIFNYGRFSSNLIVTNLAYEAALAVRQAQVYGISVKQTLVGNKFDAPYGVWFSSASPQNFYLFSDKNPDKRYDSLNENEESFSMNGSNVISNFCITDTGGGRMCSKTGALDSMSIRFKRPEPNSLIYGFLTSSEYAGSKAEIMFTSGRGDKTARMTVTSTGQISVDSCGNPAKNTTPCPTN